MEAISHLADALRGLLAQYRQSLDEDEAQLEIKARAGGTRLTRRVQALHVVAGEKRVLHRALGMLHGWLEQGRMPSVA